MSQKIRWMKIFYAANLLWAGIPGFLITFLPNAQTQILPYMVGSVPQDLLTVRILSSIWFAIGILSIFGIRNPLAFAGIFPVQIIYKTVWLTAIALPSVLQGEMRTLPLAVGFVVMIPGFVMATPWSYLFSKPQRQHVL